MKNLSVSESEKIFSQIMNGEMSDDEIEKFLLALKEKGETADEILGAIKAINYQPSTINHVVDVCGTGGDNLGTLNISTAVAFVAAGAGVKIAKHGNKAVSSKSGSSDVLSALGINIESDPQKTLATTNFGYFHAPIFYPLLKNVAPIRAKLKTRTIFNLLGPLLNPAQAKRQLIGVYSPNLLRTFAEVLRQLGSEKAWIVCGNDGLDEISISGETFVCELDGKTIDTFTITPEDADLPRHPLESIKGGDATHNAAAIIKLLNGEKGAYRDIVLLNAAAALIVAGKAENLLEGRQLAQHSIDTNQARKVLDKLQLTTRT